STGTAIAFSGRAVVSDASRDSGAWASAALHGHDRNDANQKPRRRNRSAHVFHGLHARRWWRAGPAAVDLLVQWRPWVGFGLAPSGSTGTKARGDECGRLDAGASLSTR